MPPRGPKVRLARQVGVALTPKAARIMERRPSPPGEHGSARRPQRTSAYKAQLIEKQKLRYQYDVGEKQLRKVVATAKRRPGPTDELVVSLLERRLDAIVLRAGFARTIYQARQFVSHGHVQVDGKRLDIRSARIEVGQVVAVRPASKQMPVFSPGYLHASPPGYLEVDAEAMTARLTREPARHEVPIICELPLVVEYYSR